MDGKVQEIVFVELESLQQRITERIKSTGRSASGRTVKSLRIELTKNRGTLYGRRYFGTLETGRKPGSAPKAFYQIIKQWVIDKGITFESETKRNSFAYLVSQKIIREGTKLYRDGGDSDVYSQEIPKTISIIKERLGKLFSYEIKNINLNK